jgi:hypothetical protein
MSKWSGPAITAKLLLPLILICAVSIGSVPVHDAWGLAWLVLVVLPTLAVAIWLFINIGELRSYEGGLLYRRWVPWQKVPRSRISNVKRAFPCFAAVVLTDGSKLFFFPDPGTKRMLRSFESGGTRSSPEANAGLARAMISLFFGMAVGLAVHRIPTGFTGTQSVDSALAIRVGHFYLPIFVTGSIVYLTALWMLGRLERSEHDLSLGLIGLGIVCVSTALVSAV